MAAMAVGRCWERKREREKKGDLDVDDKKSTNKRMTERKGEGREGGEGVGVHPTRRPRPPAAVAPVYIMRLRVRRPAVASRGRSGKIV